MEQRAPNLLFEQTPTPKFQGIIAKGIFFSAFYMVQKPGKPAFA
jgi:hypothetical protein